MTTTLGGAPARPRRARARLLAALALVVALAACSSGGPSTGADQPNSAAPTDGPAATYHADPNAAPPVMTTTYGLVRGARTGAVDHYHDIPFAAPPVGALRWAAPAPPKPWTGVRDGTHDGPACVQNGGLFSASSEDCLYLTVSRPAGVPVTARLPVIFWIHGGAFVGGSGDQTDPSALVTAGPAIVVTTNYRLGPLGYLVLPALLAQSGGDAGNYATEDLIAGLRWVRSNAAFFGGDPANVTIMGESAGSVNVCALMASPVATGLFQKAIMESGPCTWKLPTLQQAEQSGLALANKLGCTDPPTADFCMRFKTAQQIITAAGDDTEIFQPFTFSPATGGKILPLTPAQALWNGKLTDIPMMMGTIRDEGRPFTNHWAALGPITNDTVNTIIATHWPDRVDRLMAAYPPGRVPPRERLAEIITDEMFTCQTATFAQLTTGITQAPTYVYEFDLPDLPASSPEFLAGATHGQELGFLFPTGQTPVVSTPARQALTTAMTGYWTRFAATGSPDGSNGPGGLRSGTANWPRFTVGSVRSGDDWMQLTSDRVGSLSGVWAAHHCDVWS
jgi:para-nitrobenzyl esterase